MRKVEGRRELKFDHELMSSILDYKIYAGFTFVPVLIGIGIAYLVGFETVLGETAKWGGMAITGIALLYVSYSFAKARWNAFDSVNQGGDNG